MKTVTDQLNPIASHKIHHVYKIEIVNIVGKRWEIRKNQGSLSVRESKHFFPDTPIYLNEHLTPETRKGSEVAVRVDMGLHRVLVLAKVSAELQWWICNTVPSHQHTLFRRRQLDTQQPSSLMYCTVTRRPLCLKYNLWLF